MKNEFGKLKRKIFLWVLITAGLSLVVGTFILKVFVDGLLQTPFADGFVSLGESFLQMSREEVIYLYQQLVRNYKYLWVAVGFFIILLFIFYHALTRFTRYFKEVAGGMDKLLEETNQEISLSPEMDFMEKKLNTIKNTLEQRTQDALKAEQRKNDLVVYLAHDIKTPLTSVIGYLNLLDEAADMPDEQKQKYVKTTLDKAYRLEQLINEFFDITRFNLQTIQLNLELVHLRYMLMQMIDEFYPMLAPDDKQVQLLMEQEIDIVADADKLARVFNNILKNAVAYSDPNSTILICAQPVAGQVVITFENQGKTIPPNSLNTIFEKFYRLDSARSSNTGGAGLGLAIAREIVLAHGGSISATSAQGRTQFVVKLPYSQPASPFLPHQHPVE